MTVVLIICRYPSVSSEVISFFLCREVAGTSYLLGMITSFEHPSVFQLISCVCVCQCVDSRFQPAMYVLSVSLAHVSFS